MPSIYSLYIDDSGTRNPDRKPREQQFKDWFALGGVLIKEEDEDAIRGMHATFCSQWAIDYPLHSYDIRQKTARFAWLARLSQSELSRFMADLTELLRMVPVVGHGCVIDRPGYSARYREKYGRQTWMLCQTAFTVICERAAKHAIAENRKLRVYVEEGDKTADGHIKKYYSGMKENGMPFAVPTSEKYGPLSVEQLKITLYDLKFKKKTSPLIQLADLYLYPIARGGYDKEYLPYKILRTDKKTIDDHLSPSLTESMGVKYSCFELAMAATKTQKPRFPSASGSPQTGDLIG